MLKDLNLTLALVYMHGSKSYMAYITVIAALVLLLLYYMFKMSKTIEAFN